ncbi:MAG: hypothetical protein P9L99_01955 [Candidatus Lernaella stagnicola]|nr:hypothetical protein [Candidatus Lernaella stagnicola]
MAGYTKYEPNPWISRADTLSAAMHVLLPLAAIPWVSRALSEASTSGGMRFAAWVLFGATYLGYLVFAIVLHLEYFPERARTVGGLVLVAPLAGLVASWGGGFHAWLASTGLLLLLGLEVAVWILFFTAGKLGARDPQAPPGESKLHWNRAGRLLLSDPEYPRMIPVTIIGMFVMPGFLCLVWLAMVGGLGPRWWITIPALAAVVWCYLRVLANLAAEGRIFGPGKRAFD